MGLSFSIDAQEQEYLGALAVKAIDTAFANDIGAEPARPTHPGGAAGRDLGSFVTLTINGALRGCIGTIVAHEPLYENVWHMARAAAFNDPRFPPLTAREWPHVSLEISVLDQPSPCPNPQEIVIGRDGLILVWHGKSGVFLPQVPVEEGWNLHEYLEHLCRKAGVPQGTWKKPDAELYWYQAFAFPVRR